MNILLILPTALVPTAYFFRINLRDHNAILKIQLCIALQTLSGVSGIRMSLTFRPPLQRASITALTTAGVAPIQPASPAPFTPKGLCGQGVTWLAVSNMGMSSALGMQS